MSTTYILTRQTHMCITKHASNGMCEMRTNCCGGHPFITHTPNSVLFSTQRTAGECAQYRGDAGLAPVQMGSTRVREGQWRDHTV
jgi:hypothetical protein